MSHEVPRHAVDPTTPNVARMHDYMLGGKDNYAVDRECADQIMAEFPATRALLEANRQFLDYAVCRACNLYGIRQFLDVGSGLPTTGNTHLIARRCCADARVTYVDIDPLVCAHARALLGGDAGVAVLEGDAADVAGILHAATEAAGRAPLNLAEPVAVVMTSVLHFVERPPREILGDYLEALAPGSMVIFTHGTGDREPLERAQRIYAKANQPGFIRTPAELEAAFDGWVLEAPGLARVEYFTTDGQVPDIMATDADGNSMGYLAAVLARKPDL